MNDPTQHQYSIPTHIPIPTHIHHGPIDTIPVVPFTGLDLMMLLVVAIALVTVGLCLRRMTT